MDTRQLFIPFTKRKVPSLLMGTTTLYTPGHVYIGTGRDIKKFMQRSPEETRIWYIGREKNNTAEVSPLYEPEYAEWYSLLTSKRGGDHYIKQIHRIRMITEIIERTTKEGMLLPVTTLIDFVKIRESLNPYLIEYPVSHENTLMEFVDSDGQILGLRMDIQWKLSTNLILVAQVDEQYLKKILKEGITPTPVTAHYENDKTKPLIVFDSTTRRASLNKFNDLGRLLISSTSTTHYIHKRERRKVVDTVLNLCKQMNLTLHDTDIHTMISETSRVKESTKMIHILHQWVKIETTHALSGHSITRYRCSICGLEKDELD